MAIFYSGHIKGNSDSLHPDGNVWDWRLSSLQISKPFGISQTLPGQPKTTSIGYGVEMITDNLPPSETRTYTSDCASRSMIENLRAITLKRNSVLTITDRLGFQFTGRISSISIAENGSATEASAFYSVSITLRSIENEDDTTTKDSNILSDS